MEKGLFLGQILEADGASYSGRNLIVSPTGSGKTHFIMNELRNKFGGRKLMLLSTTSLKDSLSLHEETFTSRNFIDADQSKRRELMDIDNNNVHVMTYAEFGGRIMWNDDFPESYDVIFCDEIHSLFDYYNSFKSNETVLGIKYLFSSKTDLRIFMFTATTDKIDSFIEKEYSDLYRDVSVHNYENDGRIRRYIDKTKREFADIHQLEDIIGDIGDISKAGKKGLIFNERIDGMKRIERMLKLKGLNAESTWSSNNVDVPMNEKQIELQRVLLEEGIIPDEYDFVIINGAMREGWNLNDDRVEYVILNTLDETNRVQARGRVRKDIDNLIVRVKGENVQPIDIRIMNRERELGVIESRLGEGLTTEDKATISEELNIRREDGRALVGWRTISRVLRENNYEISRSTKRVDGKVLSTSIVTREVKSSNVENNKESLSVKSKSSKFISRLNELDFDKHNKKQLVKYMGGKGTGVAFSHIKSAYERLVIGGDWSNRKFADITYIIARDEEIFSGKNYISYNEKYMSYDEIEVMRERAKYEKSAVELLKRAEIKAIEAEQKEEDELLNYIAANS